jgi:WD40 repeat protein
LILVDLATGVELGRWQVGEGLRGLAFSPDGLKLAVLPKAPELHLLDLLEDSRRVIALPARGMSALWPEQLWVACRNGVLQRIPLDGTPLPPPTPLFESGVWHMSLLPDGRFLVGAHGGGSAPMLIWDPKTEKGEEVLGRGPSHYRNSIGKDGRLAAVGTQSGEVPIWELATGTVRQRLKADDGPTLAVAFTPDGTQLATTGFGGRVQLWDVESGALLRSVDQHGGPGTALLVTPDGEQLLSVGADRRVGRLYLRGAEALVEARSMLSQRPGEAFARLGWWERVGPEAGPLLVAQARLALGLPVEEGASPYLKILGRRR